MAEGARAAGGGKAEAALQGAAAYLPFAGRHDEGFDAAGRVRPHWARLAGWIDEAGPRAVEAAARELARLRDESGIAFTSRAAPLAPDAADPVPVVLSAADWAALELGLAQRARLAEAVIADIYGPRATLREGLIPPGLVFGSDAFAAHAAGWETPPARFTLVYEADVARGADGRWMILADRLDAPLGDGWLIANRIATSQALAEPFVDFGVRRLASHFARFQDLLDSITGWEGRLALLTGGEGDPRYFSHAYLARYLNATLVEPADLTVREGAAFLKTLDGLKKVDVLLRGVPDRRIDALHRPRSAAPGAPALTVAARGGGLVMGNAIGTAVMAYRALAPYAHVLCERLLGEPLMIADAPCLWLGDAAARAQVLDELPFWRIEPLTGGASPDRPPALPDDPAAPLTGERRDRLARDLERTGEAFAAVATPPLATSPVWSGGRLAPREWMMRAFANWTGEAWSVAPGGVAATVEPGCPPPALGFGKDVWVLPDPAAPAPDEPGSLLAARLAEGHLRRTGRDLLSRVADEVFWLGRNAERAESVLRILSVCLRRYLSGNRIDADPGALAELLAIHARGDDRPPSAARLRETMLRLACDPDEPEGLVPTLGALRSGAVRARMSISEESWRYIDRLSADPRWRAKLDFRASGEIARLIEDALRSLAAFAGSAQENLTRNFAWRFLEMGRRIERGTQIARVVGRIAGHQRAHEESFLRALLTYSDSASAYRTRYMMVPTPAAVMDLLILDETNPRALAFQLVQLEAVLALLPSDSPYRRPEHRRALALLTELRLIEADRLVATGPDGGGSARPALAALMARCRADLAEISDALARAYFAHAEAPVALVSQGRSGETR